MYTLDSRVSYLSVLLIVQRHIRLHETAFITRVQLYSYTALLLSHVPGTRTRRTRRDPCTWTHIAHWPQSRISDIRQSQRQPRDADAAAVRRRVVRGSLIIQGRIFFESSMSISSRLTVLTSFCRRPAVYRPQLLRPHPQSRTLETVTSDGAAADAGSNSNPPASGALSQTNPYADFEPGRPCASAVIVSQLPLLHVSISHHALQCLALKFSAT